MAPFQNRYFPGHLNSHLTRVAEVEGTIVGFVGWKSNEVLALYAASAWRGKQRVGRLLLQAAEAAIQAKGYKRVRIMIDADATDAQRFYMKHDYATNWDPDSEDVAWMVKDFS